VTSDDGQPYTVTRTFRMIEALAAAPMSAPQLAELLRVDARTARRMLQRAAADGWTAYRDDRSYELTPRVLAVADEARQRLGVPVPG
jgi:DNA-binding IclR family transcriptional regulator